MLLHIVKEILKMKHMSIYVWSIFWNKKETQIINTKLIKLLSDKNSSGIAVIQNAMRL